MINELTLEQVVKVTETLIKSESNYLAQNPTYTWVIAWIQDIAKVHDNPSLISFSDLWERYCKNYGMSQDEIKNYL